MLCKSTAFVLVYLVVLAISGPTTHTEPPFETTQSTLTQPISTTTQTQSPTEDTTITSTKESSEPSSEKDNTVGDQWRNSVVITEPRDEESKLLKQKTSEMFYITNGPYYVSKVSRNWDDAAQICRDVGMVLASITSQKEQLQLFKFLFVNDLVPVDDFSGYWLSGQETKDGLYNWTSIDRHIGCWGWLPNEPSHMDDSEHCVQLKFEAGSVRLGWNNFICGTGQRFICEKLKVHDKDGAIDQEKVIVKDPHIDTSCYFFYNNRGYRPYYIRF